MNVFERMDLRRAYTKVRERSHLNASSCEGSSSLLLLNLWEVSWSSFLRNFFFSSTAVEGADCNTPDKESQLPKDAHRLARSLLPVLCLQPDICTSETVLPSWKLSGWAGKD